VCVCMHAEPKSGYFVYNPYVQDILHISMCVEQHQHLRNYRKEKQRGGGGITHIVGKLFPPKFGSGPLELFAVNVDALGFSFSP
jgi:hypothetical protein